LDERRRIETICQRLAGNEFIIEETIQNKERLNSYNGKDFQLIRGMFEFYTKDIRNFHLTYCFQAMCGGDDEDRQLQATSWIAHITGELAILNVRGPDHFTQSHAHTYFIFGRLHLVSPGPHIIQINITSLLKDDLTVSR
jgi:hypothetical protein